jgi:hypothetical protein
MTVHELRTRSNAFVNNLQSYIDGVVDDNEQLLNLNREQLKEEHKNALDQFISPQYSAAYAAFKGFRTPDLYLTGDMFRAMTIEAQGESYRINSSVDYAEKLKAKYGDDIFGVAKSKQGRAKQITTKMLAELYKTYVL